MYWIWCDMRYRCEKQKHVAYKNYGGRGVKVCDRWLENFKNFHQDMGDKPDGCSLDRIDNTKGYSKENCRWATRKEQNNNRRMCLMIEYSGEMYTMSQLWEKYPKNIGVTYRAFVKRIRNGKPLEKCLFTPPCSGIKI